MLKCDKCENLIMHYFDHDLSGHEQEKLDQHLDLCSNCRLLFSQLSGILGTLENTVPTEPEPHLDRLVMDRIMSLPVQPSNNEKYGSTKLVYASFAGIVTLLLLVISLAVQGSSFPDLILMGRQYLDVFSDFMLDLQIVYQIVAGLFSSEIFSLVLGIQFVIMIAIFMLMFMAVRTVFSGPTGGHPDAS